MELTEPDESGRCKVREVPQSEFLLDVDTLIMEHWPEGGV